MIEVIVNKVKTPRDNGVEKAEIELVIDGKITLLNFEESERTPSPVDAVLGALKKHYGYEAKGWELVTKHQLGGIAATGKLYFEHDGDLFNGTSTIADTTDGSHPLLSYRVVNAAISAYFDALGKKERREYRVESSDAKQKAIK